MPVQFPNIFNVEITKGPAIEKLFPLFYKNKEANRIGARLFMNGTPFIHNGTVTGTAILNGAVTVPLTGHQEGNLVYIDLPKECYIKPGPIQVFVMCMNGTTRVSTVLAGFGTVNLTETDTMVDPDEVYTVSVATLDAQIAELEQQAIAAVASVNDAVDRAEQIASNMGYIGMRIDSNGHLIYERTENVEDIDFELVDGRLIAVWPET